MSDANQFPSLSPWLPPAPAGTPPVKPLRAIGVMGIGKIGTGLAHWCATKGMGVILYDPLPGALTQAVSLVRDLFHAAEQRNEITHAAAHKAVGGIGITTSLEDMEFCDMIVETVVEDAASKRARFTQLAGVMPKEAILASCASASGLEELFETTAEPGRVIGLGFFDPVSASPKVQVTIGSQTNRLAAERVLAFITVLGKSPVMNGKARRAE